MVADDARVFFQASGFPLLQPADVADAVWLALTSGETGHAWGVQPGLAAVRLPLPEPPRRAHGRRHGGRAAAADALSGCRERHSARGELCGDSTQANVRVARSPATRRSRVCGDSTQTPPAAARESPRRLPPQENCLVRRTASSRRPHSSSGCGGRRPSGAPRRGRRRCARRGRASPSARAGSRP